MLKPLSIQVVDVSDQICQFPDGRRFDYRMFAAKAGLSVDSPALLCTVLLEMGLDKVSLQEHIFASFILIDENENLVNAVNNTVLNTYKISDRSIILSGTFNQWERAFIQTCKASNEYSVRNIFNACYYCFKKAKLIDILQLKATRLNDSSFILELKGG